MQSRRMVLAVARSRLSMESTFRAEALAELRITRDGRVLRLKSRVNRLAIPTVLN
jgi:hypothetical protein